MEKLFPVDTGKTITLKDGRILGYEEYLHPQDISWNVNYISCTAKSTSPGSRLFSHPKLIQQAINGIHLYVLERPGFGLSTYNPNGTFLSFVSDVQEFLHYHNISRFSLLAYSAGCPFALAVAKTLKPARTAIISSIAPHASIFLYKGMPLLFKFAWFCVAHLPFIIPAFVTSTMKVKPLKDVVDEYREDAKRYSCKYDQDILLDPQVEAMFCTSEMELQSRTQGMSIAHEYKLWGKDWGFTLESFENEIHIWHGIDDLSTTIYMGRYLSRELACPIHEIPGGHMIYFNVFEEVVSWLTHSI